MKNIEGYIVVSRKFFHSSFWKEERRFSQAEAWLDLIRRAAHRTITTTIGRHQRVVGRGEFCYAQSTLAADWMWSKATVRRWLGAQVKAGRLSIVWSPESVTRKATLTVTRDQSTYLVVNYDSYQKGKPAADPQDDPQSDPSKKELVKNELLNYNILLDDSPGAPKPVESHHPAEPAVVSPRANWQGTARSQANAAGYFWSIPRIAGGLTDHVARDGAEWVLKVWKGYLEGRPWLDSDARAEKGFKGEAVEDRRFVSPNDFHDNYGMWDQRATPVRLLDLKKKLGKTGPVEGV